MPRTAYAQRPSATLLAPKKPAKVVLAMRLRALGYAGGGEPPAQEELVKRRDDKLAEALARYRHNIGDDPRYIRVLEMYTRQLEELREG